MGMCGDGRSLGFTGGSALGVWTCSSGIGVTPVWIAGKLELVCSDGGVAQFVRHRRPGGFVGVLKLR